MKRNDFIKLLKKNGWTLKRNGSNHDIYHKGKDREQYRDTSEIDEDFCQNAIIKRPGT